MILPFILFQIFNLIDFLGTYNAVIINGMFEANPLVNWLMGEFGQLTGLLIVKVLAAILATFLFIKSSKFILWVIAIWYTPLAVWQIYLYFGFVA